jgi:hypothetical protein
VWDTGGTEATDPMKAFPCAWNHAKMQTACAIFGVVLPASDVNLRGVAATATVVAV